MTLSDPNPGFKVSAYLLIEYLKNGASYRDKVTIESLIGNYNSISNGTTFN